MKKIIFALLATALMACNNGTETPVGKETVATKVQQPASDSTVEENPTENDGTAESDPAKVIAGTWTGTMNDKKLTVVIEEFAGTALVGYDMLGTNKRNLQGTFTEGAWDQPCAKAYEAVLKEPGDDQWDGVFTIKFVGYEDSDETETGPECAGNLKGVEAYGEWKSNNGKKNYSFSLIKN